MFYFRRDDEAFESVKRERQNNILMYRKLAVKLSSRNEY